MIDVTKAYLEKHGLPVNRENYININWLGDYDPEKPLPAELEASLPEELQLKGGTDANEK